MDNQDYEQVHGQQYAAFGTDLDAMSSAQTANSNGNEPVLEQNPLRTAYPDAHAIMMGRPSFVQHASSDGNGMPLDGTSSLVPSMMPGDGPSDVPPNMVSAGMLCPLGPSAPPFLLILSCLHDEEKTGKTKWIQQTWLLNLYWSLC